MKKLVAFVAVSLMFTAAANCDAASQPTPTPTLPLSLGMQAWLEEHYPGVDWRASANGIDLLSPASNTELVVGDSCDFTAFLNVDRNAYFCRSIYLTVLDNAGVRAEIRSIDELKRVFAPVDNAGEAAAWVFVLTGQSAGGVARDGDDFLVWAVDTDGNLGCKLGPDELFVFRITANGDLTTDWMNQRQFTALMTCASPGIQPVSLT